MKGLYVIYGVLLTLILLLPCCTTQQEEENKVQQTVIFGRIEAVSGRNRIQIRWDGVNNTEHVLRFVISGDKILDVGHRTSGSEIVEGLAEGPAEVTVQLVNGNNVVGQISKSVTVLGAVYEDLLPRWGMSHSLENGAFSCTMKSADHAGLYAEEFVYMNARGVTAGFTEA